MALVIAGADLAVRGGTDMGLALGMTPLAIGAIVFAVGTSLPELTVSLAAVRKGKADVVLGEVYASNIFTATVVLGSTLIIRPLEVVPPALLRVDLPLLVLGAALMQVMATSDLKLERWEGAVAIGLYGWYVYLHLV
jgi:cation:H+ antiporter